MTVTFGAGRNEFAKKYIETRDPLRCLSLKKRREIPSERCVPRAITRDMVSSIYTCIDHCIRQILPKHALICAFGLLAVHCGLSMDMLTTISMDGGVDIDTGTEHSDSNIFFESDVSTDTVVCTRGEIQPSEVLLIGDSWISFAHSGVGELARADGILDFDEDYVSRAFAGQNIDSIVQQYETYLSFGDARIKVLIMNGGAVDTYRDNASDKSIAHVTDTFVEFLNQLKGSLVEHVIYVLYSEGTAIPGVPKLRPLMREACSESAISCHFVDLQPLWHPDYMSFDNINPNSDGAKIIAGAIWQEMKDNCIAQ